MNSPEQKISTSSSPTSAYTAGRHLIPRKQSPAPHLRLDPEKSLQGLDWKSIFGNENPVEIEIGLGKGRFLLAAAAAKPELNFLGIEWANQYLRIAEERAAKRGLTNLRFLRVDAAQLLAAAIKPGSVSAFYIFYPDPWPKLRHHKRRLLQLPVANDLAKALKPSGKLYIATDHDQYWSEIEPLFDKHPAFQRLPEFATPEFPLIASEPLTNYEEKYLTEGRSRHRATWQRFF